MEGIRAALKKCSDAEVLLNGSDELSGMVQADFLNPDELNEWELAQAAGGRLDPGNRIWKKVLTLVMKK